MFPGPRLWPRSLISLIDEVSGFASKGGLVFFGVRAAANRRNRSTPTGGAVMRGLLVLGCSGPDDRGGVGDGGADCHRCRCGDRASPGPATVNGRADHAGVAAGGVVAVFDGPGPARRPRSGFGGRWAAVFCDEPRRGAGEGNEGGRVQATMWVCVSMRMLWALTLVCGRCLPAGRAKAGLSTGPSFAGTVVVSSLTSRLLLFI